MPSQALTSTSAQNSKSFRTWTSCQKFWFARIDARPLALFRIATGILCFFMFLALIPNWSRFFSPDGIISLTAPGLENARVNSSLGLFYWTDAFIPVEAFCLISIGVSITYIFGIYTRISTFLLLVLLDAMVHRNPYIVNGEELVLRMCLLYCLFIDLGRVWSWDSWRRKLQHKESECTLFAWPVRMMQINIALIYAISLPYKFVQDPGWVTGDALHWTVASDMWGPSTMPWITLAFGGLLRKIMTFGTVIVEGSFPLLVWFKPTRLAVLLPLAGLHIGIALMIPNVTFFTLSMVCVFACYLTGRDIDWIKHWAIWFYKKCFSTGQAKVLAHSTTNY